MSMHFAPPVSTVTRISILQGQSQVSTEPLAEFSTLLGSCVATCLFDPVAQVGGMNHFLLAEPPAACLADFDEHYGVYLMELLINDMLAHGAAKARLRAHLYGGANLNAGLERIGLRNGEFARQFLNHEGIVIAREDLGGIHARRVDFRPARGQVRCRIVENTLVSPTTPTPRPQRADGNVELF
jgi:chemotaxis protein CheD